MTVNTTDITSGPYIGNGAADQYDYDFRVTDKTQLKVFETTDLGVETELTVDVDFTVAGLGDDAGGVITRVAGNLPTDYQWYIRSDYDTSQLTAFASQGGFFPDVHENAMDKITFILQQLYDLNARSFRISESDPDTSAIVELPVAAERASKVLSFDALGDLIVAQNLGDWRGDWVTATVYGIRDMFRDPVTSSVYFTTVEHTSTSIAADLSSGYIDVLIDAAIVGTKAAEAAASAAAALVSENAAAVSAAAALASESAAAASESAAAASESAAAASEAAAAASESAASISETNSAASAAAALASESAAAASESAAAASESAAAASAAAALVSQNAASSSASAASASAAAALASESAAAASESAAAASAAAALASESAAAASEAAALVSENAAAVSAADAASSAASAHNKPARNAVLNQEAVTQGESTDTGVSSTIYTGNGTSQSVTTGVDMDTGDFGGLVWVKNRSSVFNNWLSDSIRGASERLMSDLTNAESTVATGVTSFDATGFSVGDADQVNVNTDLFVAWSFQTNKKTPKNLLTYSEQFDNAAWVPAAASVIANSVSAPDGTTTADTLTADGTTDFHGLYESVAVIAETRYTESFFIKEGTTDVFSAYEGFATGAAVTFDLTAKTATPSGGGSPSGTITELDDGWFRCSMSFTTNIGQTSARSYILVGIASANANSGNGYIWGAQLNEQDSAGDYIQTVAAASNPLTNRGKEYISHYNADLGFSIVGYEGDGAWGHEIPHHLGVEPELSIFKNRDAIVDWGVISTLFAKDEYLNLNDTGALGVSSNLNNIFTDTSISLGPSNLVNTAAANYISYHFASKPGVSKVGKYIGTGAAGNYVDCGFKPAFVMMKNLTNAGNWIIWDGIRGVVGSTDYILYPNLSNAESGAASRIDFVDDGFAMVGFNADYNDLNDEYLFLAFAETDIDATKAWTDFTYPTTADTLSIENNTVVSVANGFNSSGQVDTQYEFTGGKTHVLGAGYENKKLHVYTDKLGEIGVSEHRPLIGWNSRDTADKWGEVSPLDASLRTTAKHFDYESETGVALASGERGADYAALYGFNKDSNDLVNGLNSYWEVASITTSWLQYKQNEKRILKSWRMRTGAVARLPKRFTIEGSNDGLNWGAIDSSYAAADYVGNGANLWGDLQDVSANTGAYLYHRINTTANNGDATYTQIAELEFNTILPADYYLVEDGKMYRYLGDEEVTNGTFDTDTTGWDALNNASLTIDTNRLKVSYVDTEFGGAEQAISLAAGTYTVSADYDNNSSNNRIYLQVGTTSDGTDLLSVDTGIISTTATGTISGTFELSSTTTVYAQVQIATGAVNALFDNISIKEIAPSVERTYLAEVDTNANGEVINITNYPVAKQNFGDVEVQNDLVVHGEIENVGVATAWVNFSGNENPPLIRDSYNVKDVVDLGTGIYKIIFETPMSNIAYTLGGTPNFTTSDDGFWAVTAQNNGDVSLRCRTHAGTLNDGGQMQVQIFGGKEIG